MVGDGALPHRPHPAQARAKAWKIARHEPRGGCGCARRTCRGGKPARRHNVRFQLARLDAARPGAAAARSRLVRGRGSRAHERSDGGALGGCAGGGGASVARQPPQRPHGCRQPLQEPQHCRQAPYADRASTRQHRRRALRRPGVARVRAPAARPAGWRGAAGGTRPEQRASGRGVVWHCCVSRWADPSDSLAEAWTQARYEFHCRRGDARSSGGDCE
mmetsp:Transcript_43259/g.113654  ORF Transcript_43259/g.113654 Transcript_43259/m.113654 type:complete len:218 (-) Transcript_43259:1259-1912(-)